MVRESLKILLAVCLLFLFLASCSLGGGRNRKTAQASTGQPYEVVLKGDTDSIVTKILTEDVPALPQPEPLCRLIQVKKGKIHDSYLLVRTRIVVNIPSSGILSQAEPQRECFTADCHPHLLPARCSNSERNSTPRNCASS